MAVYNNCVKCACGIVAVLQIIAKSTAMCQGVNGNSGTINSRINAGSQLDAGSRIDAGGLDQLYE